MEIPPLNWLCPGWRGQIRGLSTLGTEPFGNVQLWVCEHPGEELVCVSG